VIDEDSFVIADIPGLIEGAHEGAGLGDRFLGHIERSGALIHLVDGTSENVAESYRTIRHELDAYGHGLETRPELLCLNKADALTEEARAEQKAALEDAAGKAPFIVSGASGEGVKDVLRAAWKDIQTAREEAVS